jgi:hypothetical protein
VVTQQQHAGYKQARHDLSKQSIPHYEPLQRQSTNKASQDSLDQQMLDLEVLLNTVSVLQLLLSLLLLLLLCRRGPAAIAIALQAGQSPETMQTATLLHAIMHW